MNGNMLNQVSILSRINLELFSKKIDKTFESVIRFSESHKSCCVSMVDIVNSTKIIASLPQNLACKYYFIFLNSMSLIAKEYGAKIVKNMGDSLLYYFPNSVNSLDNFKQHNTIECNLSMLEAHDKINKIMFRENLPPIDYRISVDYGSIMEASCFNLKSEDIFGYTVNMCAKMNSMANPNSMIIGQDLYQIIKKMNYSFSYVGDYDLGGRFVYSTFLVSKKSEL